MLESSEMMRRVLRSSYLIAARAETKFGSDFPEKISKKVAPSKHDFEKMYPLEILKCSPPKQDLKCMYPLFRGATLPIANRYSPLFEKK